MSLNTESKKRSIRNYLINAPFQLRVLGYFAGLFVVSTFTFYALIFWFFYQWIQTARRVGIPEGHVFYTFIDQQKLQIDVLFFGFALFYLVILVVFGLVVSHRIAGPIVKLKRHLEALAHPTQTPAPFALRKNDFFKDLEPAVNQLRTSTQHQASAPKGEPQ